VGRLDGAAGEGSFDEVVEHGAEALFDAGDTIKMTIDRSEFGVQYYRRHDVHSHFKW
jgi:hypothetical protein